MNARPRCQGSRLRLPQASRSPSALRDSVPLVGQAGVLYRLEPYAQILNGTETPKQAADIVQKDLASWYKPQQGT